MAVVGVGEETGGDADKEERSRVLLASAQPRQFGDHVGEAGWAAVDEWEGPADLDGGDANAGGEKAVHDAFPELGRQARGDAVADELRDEGVAGRHAAGDGEMTDGGAGEAEEAEGAWASAVEHGEAADETKDLGADEEQVDEGAGRDGCNEGYALG